MRPRNVFHRKNYFYPDLPKAYQISQYDEPLAVNGRFEYWLGDERLSCRIHRVHLEEDAAKLLHAGGETGRIAGSDYSMVDFNRGGTPLVEIVTEPDIPSPQAAGEFLKQMRNLIVELGVSECNMEEGQVRWDANISVRPAGSAELGTRTELKNMNSFRFLQQALEAELPRQVEILEAGGTIEQETLHFDPETGTTTPLRSKEEAHDYRYFPEPDLVPFVDRPAWVEELRAEPARAAGGARRALRATSTGCLATTRSSSAARAPWRASTKRPPRAAPTRSCWRTGPWASTWGTSTPPGSRSARGTSRPRAWRGSSALISDGTVSSSGAKDVFRLMVEERAEPAAIVEKHGLAQVSDAGELEGVVAQVIADNPRQVEQFKAGKEQVAGFFVGQVMKATQGRANPKLVNELVRKALAQV